MQSWQLNDHKLDGGNSHSGSWAAHGPLPIAPLKILATRAAKQKRAIRNNAEGRAGQLQAQALQDKTGSGCIRQQC